MRAPDIPGSDPTEAVSPGSNVLTGAERALVRSIAAVHDEFCALPERRPGELDEWVSGVHRLQDMVMSRAAARAYPDEFTPLFPREHAATDT